MKPLFTLKSSPSVRVQNALSGLVNTQNELKAAAMLLNDEYEADEAAIQALEDKKSATLKCISQANIAAQNIGKLLGE